MRIVAALTLVFAAACVGPGLLGDGSSVSVGTHARGTVRHAARLPVAGEGYTIPPEWRLRKRNYGTDEIVELIVRAARRVRRETRGGVLGVADLSQRTGGGSPEHRSHQNGRDADLIPYAICVKGKPLPPPSDRMIAYGADGKALAPSDGKPVDPKQLERRYDDARNWALVRALLTDPRVDVQWIFVGAELEERLLAYAVARGEPPALIAHAKALLHQPGDAQRHDDHMHLRVFCEPGDRTLGCSDRGPARWLKKELKLGFSPGPRASAIESLAGRLLASPLWHVPLPL